VKRRDCVAASYRQHRHHTQVFTLLPDTPAGWLARGRKARSPRTLRGRVPLRGYRRTSSAPPSVYRRVHSTTPTERNAHVLVGQRGPRRTGSAAAAAEVARLPAGARVGNTARAVQLMRPDMFVWHERIARGVRGGVACCR
jgi:hypothetical protein